MDKHFISQVHACCTRWLQLSTLCCFLFPGPVLGYTEETASDGDLDFLVSGKSETVGDARPGVTEQGGSPAEPEQAVDALSDRDSASEQPQSSQRLTTARARSRRIEEIVVTAQKREEAIQDVPISMSVMTGDFMQEQGISDLATAMLFVPNVKITSAGFFAAPNARGFTFNNNNKAFEPPLGLAVDGIPYTRIPYFLAATFDLQRIEVLRGPQGTTFGKNTTAGLIHMITNDPTDEFTGFFSQQYGELDRRRTELAVSGPLVSDVVNFRIAGFIDQRDGYVENTTRAVNRDAQDSFLGHDRDGFRGKLEFVDIAGSQLKLSYENVRLDDFGTGAQIIRATPQVRAYLQLFDPDTDFDQGNYVASMDAPDSRQIAIETFGAEWNYDLNDWGLVALGSHSVLDNAIEADVDFTPAPALIAFGGDESPTDTLEFRVLSPELKGFFGLASLFGHALGSSDFVIGVFQQKRAINDSLLGTVADIPSFVGLTVAAEAEAALPNSLAGLLAQTFDLSRPILAPLLPGLEGQLVETASQGFEQKAESLAIFGEFKWRFLPTWTLQAGMRQGNEKKRGLWNQSFDQPQPAVLLPLAGFEEFQAQREIEEDQFQHKISLNWQPLDNISLFLHRAESVKGGGFNAFAFTGADADLLYKPEFTTEWSLNAKTNWLSGTLNANLALYRMDVDDFQVLIRDASQATIGIGTSRVINAASARAQGIEGDLQWLATDWLTLIGTLGYNDTEYLDFKQNECPADRPMDGGCDATGKAFPFTPKWNNTLTSLVRLPLFGTGLEFTGSVTIEQLSEQPLDVDLDERKVQGDFERYKASVGIGNPRQGWSFRIVGENLTDEETGVRQGDVSPGIFVEVSEPPRLIYGQFSWRF